MQKMRGGCGGFTLVELVMVIVLLGILSAVAVSTWPSGMKEAAARRELKRAFRYAQHHAMTRKYTGPVTAWALTISNNRYTIQRSGGSETAEPDYQDRYLLDDDSITLTGPATVRFNGLGEPIASDGSLTAGDHFTVAGTLDLAFCPETGFVQEGSTCP